MKIALINASPKGPKSASHIFLGELAPLLGKHSTVAITLNRSRVEPQVLALLLECDAWVFAAPLYADGVPSHLLACLCQLENQDLAGRGIRVCALWNAGFYEGIQNQVALKIMENWCLKAGLSWVGGIGYGGGGALPALASIPPGKGPKASLVKPLTALVAALEAGQPLANAYPSVGLPRVFYKMAAEMGWNQAIKANGGTPKDLDKRV